MVANLQFSSDPAHASELRVVDLTLLIAEELPCWWAAHMPFQHKTFNYFTDVDSQAAPLESRTGPYQTRWLLIDEHTGTHLDAPAHFIPPPDSALPHAAEIGNVTIEQVDLAQAMGPAVVIDVPEDLSGAAPGVSPIITPDVVRDHEEQYGQLQSGSIVLFRSGWDRLYKPGAEGDPYCYNPLILKTSEGWPAPGVECMQLLIERGIKCAGIDSPSMGSSHDGGPVHVEGLSHGVAYIEALTNLDKLPNLGAWFCFASLKLKRGTGGPGRAFAFLPATDAHQ